MVDGVPRCSRLRSQAFGALACRTPASSTLALDPSGRDDGLPIVLSLMITPPPLLMFGLQPLHIHVSHAAVVFVGAPVRVALDAPAAGAPVALAAAERAHPYLRVGQVVRVAPALSHLPLPQPRHELSAVLLAGDQRRHGLLAQRLTARPMLAEAAGDVTTDGSARGFLVHLPAAVPAPPDSWGPLIGGRTVEDGGGTRRERRGRR